jgi:hypothetical protein
MKIEVFETNPVNSIFYFDHKDFNDCYHYRGAMPCGIYHTSNKNTGKTLYLIVYTVKGIHKTVIGIGCSPNTLVHPSEMNDKWTGYYDVCNNKVSITFINE